MKILSIGNSFSQDAQRYLHGVAEEIGVSLDCTNLYIGGCSLSIHHQNYLEEAKRYDEEVNGVSTGNFISIQDALAQGGWDVVTLQNVSAESPFYDTYQPHLSFLADRIREALPAAKLYLHATWAYDEIDPRLHQLGFADHGEMSKAIFEAYSRAAKDIAADGMIPSTLTVENLYSLGIKKPHRDGFHMGLGCGRYAVACTWLETLTGASAFRSNFANFDIPIRQEEILIAKRAAHLAADKFRKKKGTK